MNWTKLIEHLMSKYSLTYEALGQEIGVSHQTIHRLRRKATEPLWPHGDALIEYAAMRRGKKTKPEQIKREFKL